MNGAKLRFKLILLMTLILSGQVIASPFLSCPMSSMTMSEAESNMPCEDMMIMATDSEESGMAMNMDMSNSAQHDCDCDLLCGYCLGFTSVVLPGKSTIVVSLFHSVIVTDSNSIFTSSSSENPFRPPIFA